MYGRTMPTQPSLFIREIDKNFIKTDYRTVSFGQPRQSMPSRSFNPYNFNNAAAVKSEVEERSGWRRGQRLFHDDHGYGAVMEVKDSEDGPVVRVRFDNGTEKRFLSEYQGKAYEKMGDDY